MENLLSYYGQFMELSKANPIVASVLATGVSGSLFMIMRGLPGRIVNGLRRAFMHSIILETPQQRWVYEAFQEFISENGLLFSRSFTVRNMGQRDKAYLVNSVGHQHWFYGGNLWLIGVAERDSQGISEQKYSMALTVYAFSRKPLERLMHKVDRYTSRDLNSRYEYFDPHDNRQMIPNRPMGTVILNRGIWEQITGAIDRFLSSEEWHVEKGVPYTLAIMLAGPPGTGKSSILSAIASHYSATIKDSSRSLWVAESTGAKNGNIHTITVMEDIEHHALFKDASREGGGEGSAFGRMSNVTITEFLNQLSGTGARHGSITIMTSNDLSALPEQLLRPGRTNLIVEIGYLDQEAIGRYVEHVYGATHAIHPDTPPHRASYLQTTFLSHLEDPEGFIEVISKPEPLQEQRSYLQ